MPTSTATDDAAIARQALERLEAFGAVLSIKLYRLTLDPPPVVDWWTAVGSAAPHGDGVHTQGPGSALLVRGLTRLLQFGD